GSLRLRICPDKNLICFMLAQGQMIAAHFDFHRIAERREADQFNRGSHQQAHFEQATTVFGGHFDFGDSRSGTDRQSGQRLAGGGHSQATFSSARSGSTQIESASSALMPTRTLQTWQMTLVCWLRSLTRCSSQKPISRRRWTISGEAESCLIRQAAPARSLLRGRSEGRRVGN